MSHISNWTTEGKSPQGGINELLEQGADFKHPFSNLKLNGDALDDIPNDKIKNHKGEKEVPKKIPKKDIPH